jgi:hypothetical protein
MYSVRTDGGGLAPLRFGGSAPSVIGVVAGSGATSDVVKVLPVALALD